MALVHVRKEEANVLGKPSWLLRDPTGLRIAVFDKFCKNISGLEFESRERYTTVVSRFIDYLYEVRVLGAGPVTRSAVNEAIDFYMVLLRDGEAVSLAIRKRRNVRVYVEGDQAREARLREVANRLGITPLAANSWSNTIAPLNTFLRTCAEMEREVHELSLLKGGVAQDIVLRAQIDYRPLLEAVSGVSTLSFAEVQNIKHSSMLGGVIRFRGGKELTRPRGLRQSAREISGVSSNLAFPEERFGDLIDAATSWRDRALWTLEYGTGVRRSEGLNLRWCDIDFAEREVYVLDPALLRYGRDITPEVRDLRFKGRTVSWTYFRQPYRDWFFDFIHRYRREEYRLPQDGNDYVFQYLIAPHYGRPLHEASDETLNAAFKTAVVRADIPGPPVDRSYVWSSHSLRHGYANFMTNEFQVPGQAYPGVTLSEAQMLLGHKDLRSTQKYVKREATKLKEKLLAHDVEYADIASHAPKVLAAPAAESPRLH